MCKSQGCASQDSAILQTLCYTTVPMTNKIQSLREWLTYFLFPITAMRRRNEWSARVKKVTKLVALCDEAVRQTDYSRAQLLYEEGLVEAGREGDPWEVGTLLLGLGHVAAAQDDSALTQSSFDKSLNIFLKIDYKIGIAQAHLGLGIAAMQLMKYAQARHFFAESLAEFRDLNQKEACAYSLQSLGMIAQLRGDYLQAISFYEESLAISRDSGSNRTIASALTSLGSSFACVGDTVKAQALFEEGLLLSREVGYIPQVIAVLISFGFFVAHDSLNTTQQQRLEEALNLSRQTQDRKSTAYALNNLGNIARFVGDYSQASTYYTESLTIKRKLKDRWGITYSLEGCAGVAVVLGNPERAMCLLGAADVIRETLETPREPFLQADYDRTLDQASHLLDTKTLAVAQAQGRGMTWEQAVDYALEQKKPLLLVVQQLSEKTC